MSLEIKDERDRLKARDAGLEWFRYLESSWHRRRQEWMDNYRNYSNIYHKRFYSGRAQIFVPLSFQLVESFIPAMAKGVFATTPHFNIQPVDLDKFLQTPEAIDDLTEKIRALLHFEQSKKIHTFRKSIDFFRNMCIYGRGIQKGFWRHETDRRNLKTIDQSDIDQIIRVRREEADVVTYDAVDFENLDIFSIWVDPESPDSNIQRAACVTERHLRSTDYLRRMSKTIGAHGKPIFEGIPDEILKGDESKEGRKAEAETEDERRQLNEEQGKSTSLVPRGARKHELLEFWWDYPIRDKNTADRNSVMVLLNRTHVIRINRNPFF